MLIKKEMTRRKKPINKTIVVEAKNGNVTVTFPADSKWPGAYLTPANPPKLDEYGCIAEEKPFVFPVDLDKIQPEQINGNLTIRFPD